MAAASLLAITVAGAAQAQAPAPAAAAPAGEQVVVVRGFRASLQNALNTKKNSNQIIESVTAEDMGKFPDQNITESLQRLPGIQIDRENGQGTKVRIRGLDQNVTLLNGDNFLSGLEAFRLGEGNNKQTNSLEGIPSDLLGGVDVIKSPQADLVEGGLGGTVNLKTRNARDLKDDTTISADIRYNKGSFRGKGNTSGSFVFGHKFSSDFAVLASLSYDKTDVDTEILSGENRGSWAYLARPTATGNNQVQTGTSNIWSPEYRYTNNRHQERERTAFSLNADWKVSDELTLRADWFHSDLKIFTGEHSLKWAYANENATYNSATVVKDSDGVLTSASVTSNSAEGDTFAKDAEAKTDNLQLTANWNNGGKLSGKFKAAYSKSDYASNSAQVDTRYTQYGVRNGTTAGLIPNATAPVVAQYNYLNGDYPIFDPFATLKTAMTTPSSVFYKSHWAFGDKSKITNLALAADFKYHPDFAQGAGLVLSFGARYGDRKITSDYGRYLADYSAKGELAASTQGTTINGTFIDWTPLGYFQDGAIGLKKCDVNLSGCGRFGNSVAVVTPYQTAASNPERGVVDNVHGVSAIFQDYNQMKSPVGWIQALYPSTKFEFYRDPIESFKIREKTTSGYAMADLGDKGDGYHINAGVRIVSTELIIDSSNTPAVPLWWGTDSWNGILKNPDSAHTVRKYTDILPSISGVFDINENDKVRVTAARVVASQNLFDLGQGASYNFTRSSTPGPNFDKFLYTNGSGGNPNLDPFRASQLDAAYEHYFGRQGIISAGVFYKTVDSFIVENTYTVTVKDQSVAGSSVGTFRSASNGEGGKIKGVELQAQYSFESGFGFTANATYSDSESPYFNDFENGLPIPGVSKLAYNAQGYYENGPFQTRVSYAWRDKAFLGNFGFGSGTDTHKLGIYNKSYGQIDAQVSYDILPNLKVTLEGSNLTKEDAKTYLQYESLPFRFVSGDRRVTVGLRYKFGG